MGQQPEYLDDVFNCPPAYNAIFACLSPADITRAGKTCRLFQDAVGYFQGLAYSINRHLEHFVKDSLALRRFQVKDHFLISGSNALQFLDRTFYPTSDLDIFAYPEGVKELGRHLIKNEGYVFKPGPKQPKEFAKVIISPRDLSTRHRIQHHADFVYNTGMSDLLKFENPERGLEIQIICCRRTPLDCILYFHSTCVMNFITHDTAYALYPKATFDKRLAVAFGWDSHDATRRAYEKYTERGWTFVTDMGYQGVESLKSAIVPDITRYLDDKYTWRVPLDTTGLDLGPSLSEESKPIQNPFHCNSWSLNRDFNGYSTEISLGISYHVYDSPHLEHTYLIAEHGFQDAIEQLLDYVIRYNPSKLAGNKSKYLDTFLPELRDAHNKLSKRIHSID